MSKRSTSTIREQPVPAVASGSGAFLVRGETFIVPTDDRVQVVDVTDRVVALVGRAGIREGLASLCSLHTTCAVFINESQRALRADMKSFLERVVDEDAAWMHNDPAHSDCDRANADAHLRAMLLGHGLSLQVSGGEVVLGQWQRILLAELDGPRPRTLRLQIMGVS
jgi:secondary thiamine-phosphate synthase enzyme